MPYERQPGDVAIFKNSQKKSDSHPDYTLKGLSLDGEPIEGGLWIKKTQNGDTFIAGRFRIDEYAQHNQTHQAGDTRRQPTGSFTPPPQAAPNNTAPLF